MTKIIKLISETQPPIEGALSPIRQRVQVIIQHPSEDTFLCLDQHYGVTLVGGGIEIGETFESATYREVIEETGYFNIGAFKDINLEIWLLRKHEIKEENLQTITQIVFCKLQDLDQHEAEFTFAWIERDKVASTLNVKVSQLAWEHFINGDI